MATRSPVVLRALALLAVAVTPQLACATLLAASRIEACVDSGGGAGAMACARRLVVTLSVQNGENASESVTAAAVASAVDPATGAVYDLAETLEVTLAKSPIQLQYPLAYARLFNAAPYEVVRTADAGGRSFNFLTNPCVDDPSRDGACGWVLTPAGERVPSSNGFCCRCDAAAYFGGGTAAASRAALQCNLLDASNSQSAHCLRMGPLWYAGFTVGPSRVHYTVDVVFRRCVRLAAAAGNGTASAGASSCSYDLARLSPSAPGACRDFPRIDGTPPGNASACDAWVSLEGDFAAFEAAPDFSDRLLMVPQACEDVSRCGNRTAESADRWLLVPASETTTGSTCDRVGVSYSGFSGQGSRCEQPAGSCLRGQLDDAYRSDTDAERAGRVGSYFTGFHARALGGAFVPALTSAATARMAFTTARYQRSVVTMYLNADSLSLTQRVVVAVITAVDAPPFEAASRSGRLSVTVANTAAIGGLVTVTVTECTDGVDAVPAQQATLGAAPAAATLRFALVTASQAAGAYACNVAVANSLFRVTDSRRVGFNTTPTVVSAGEQGGSPAPGAPADGAAPSPVPAASCEDACPSAWDPVCAVVHRCVGRIAGWAGGVAGALLAVAVPAKFPFLVSAPLRLVGGGALAALRLCGCNSGGGSESGGRRESGKGRSDGGHRRRQHGGGGERRRGDDDYGRDHDDDGGDDDDDSPARRRRQAPTVVRRSRRSRTYDRREDAYRRSRGGKDGGDDGECGSDGADGANKRGSTAVCVAPGGSKDAAVIGAAGAVARVRAPTSPTAAATPATAAVAIASPDGCDGGAGAAASQSGSPASALTALLRTVTDMSGAVAALATQVARLQHHQQQPPAHQQPELTAQDDANPQPPPHPSGSSGGFTLNPLHQQQYQQQHHWHSAAESLPQLAPHDVTRVRRPSVVGTGGSAGGTAARVATLMLPAVPRTPAANGPGGGSNGGGGAC
jgi:hypothetical protein